MRCLDLLVVASPVQYIPTLIFIINKQFTGKITRRSTSTANDTAILIEKSMPLTCVVSTPALGLGAALLIGRAGSPQRAASDSEIDFFFYFIDSRYPSSQWHIRYVRFCFFAVFFPFFFVTAIRLSARVFLSQDAYALNILKFYILIYLRNPEKERARFVCVASYKKSEERRKPEKLKKASIRRTLSPRPVLTRTKSKTTSTSLA